MELVWTVVWLLGLMLYVKSEKTPQPPNIIFIFADDLGWNDVSFHGSPDIPTPNIDALAMSGVTLNNYYGEWMCTPSRGAFITGKYPIRLGLQHFVIKTGEATALPLNEITLPQYLKNLGYETHLVGKWHLGYQTTEYTPTKRGFDSFFGYLTGHIDYYDFTTYGATGLPELPRFYGIDLHNGTNPVTDVRGVYAPYAFADQAQHVILNHDSSKPLFLYFSQLSVHLGNAYMPFQAPPEKISQFKYIKDLKRRTHAGMVSVLDDTVGTVFEALRQKNMLENSIVMFVSDNGGETVANGRGVSSNHPLRGQKQTYWEGGIRLPAVVWSPLLKLKKPRISKQLMHVSDWLPTFYSAAGGDPADLGDIDGHNLWKSLTDDLPSPRKSLLHNLDPVFGTSAFREGHYKVVNGTAEEVDDKWYGPTGFENLDPPPSMYDRIFQNSGTVREILQRSGWWIVESPDEWYEGNRVTCEQPPPEERQKCDPSVKPCLFNITADPCEYVDLADQFPEIVRKMMHQIENFQNVSVKPQSKPSDPRGDPACHNFIAVPWLDSEHLKECNYLQHTAYNGGLDCLISEYSVHPIEDVDDTSSKALMLEKVPSAALSFYNIYQVNMLQQIFLLMFMLRTQYYNLIF